MCPGPSRVRSVDSSLGLTNDVMRNQTPSATPRAHQTPHCQTHTQGFVCCPLGTTDRRPSREGFQRQCASGSTVSAPNCGAESGRRPRKPTSSQLATSATMNTGRGFNKLHTSAPDAKTSPIRPSITPRAGALRIEVPFSTLFVSLSTRCFDLDDQLLNAPKKFLVRCQAVDMGDYFIRYEIQGANR